FRNDGKVHVEIVEQRAKTEWLVPYLADLLKRHEGSILVTDASALDTSKLAELTKLELEPILTNAQELARACGMLYDAVEQKTLCHLGEPELSDAILCAVKRPLSDAWAWKRKDATGD